MDKCWDDGQMLGRDSYLVPPPNQDSRPAFHSSGGAREGIPKDVGARKDSRTSVSEVSVRERIHARACMAPAAGWPISLEVGESNPASTRVPDGENRYRFTVCKPVPQY